MHNLAICLAFSLRTFSGFSILFFNLSNQPCVKNAVTQPKLRYLSVPDNSICLKAYLLIDSAVSNVSDHHLLPITQTDERKYKRFEGL